MKINLTTTTITPPAESLLTFEQLKEADSGVYLCQTHQHENPSQRIIKDGEDLFLCDCRGPGGGFISVPDDHQENAGCRFILAPEQIVNITFAKEEPALHDAGVAAIQQSLSKFKVGDKVRVVREPKENENGWSDWVEQLAGAVGGVFKVEDVIADSGVDIALLGADGYWFPFFVLEKVA